MRLSCPNCDAQYEVPDEVMPLTGRDVQCSNCGKTWFQYHPDNMPSEAEDPALVDQPDPDEEVSPPPPQPKPEQPAVSRRQLDPEVADILREEAETEFAARARDARGGVESQPDLGLEEEPDRPIDPAERRAQEARRRMARMRGEPDPEAEAGVAATAGSRRALLPDIDEINSTLRSEKGRSRSDVDLPEGSEAGRDTPKRGFRGGFYIGLLLFAIAAIIYLYRAQIVSAVPALEGPLAAYGAWVDQMRLLLDVQIARLSGWLQGLTAGQ